MKCCPKDKNIKKEWTNKLEGESNNISNNTVIEISNFCKVFSYPIRLKIALLLNIGDLYICEIQKSRWKEYSTMNMHSNSPEFLSRGMDFSDKVYFRFK